MLHIRDRAMKARKTAIWSLLKLLMGRQKKKRGQRAQVGDKAGKGLRHFSMKAGRRRSMPLQKMEGGGVAAAYCRQVADELVQEFSLGEGLGMGSEQLRRLAQSAPPVVGTTAIDEKNIRRRVYDALNVLMAMDIIAKEKKEIHWRGLPYATGAGFELLQGECTKVVGQERLVHRNEASGVTHGSQSQGGIQLPFLLVQTRPQATVEVEISENMQLVNFDFNRTQFEVHDDSYVLRAMGLCQLDPRKPAVVAAPQREDQPGGAHLVPPHPVPVQLNGYAGPPPGHSHSNLGGAGTAQQ
eukprot:jgi/Mesen1/7164/ME000037S06523